MELLVSYCSSRVEGDEELKTLLSALGILLSVNIFFISFSISHEPYFFTPLSGFSNFFSTAPYRWIEFGEKFSASRNTSVKFTDLRNEGEATPDPFTIFSCS